MPHVVHRRLELGQDEGAAAQEAPELEHPAPRGPEEQVVIEEAGVDRLLQEELITGHAGAVHEDERDALFVEHLWPFIGVGHHHLGRARHIAGVVRPSPRAVGAERAVHREVAAVLDAERAVATRRNGLNSDGITCAGGNREVAAINDADGAVETGCETVSDADSSTSIGGYREAAAVLDAERTVCGSGGRDP
jgi:hypothetical protein